MLCDFKHSTEKVGLKTHPGNVNRARPHIACTDADNFFSTSHMMLHAHTWLKLNCVPKTSSHSISCFAPCVTTGYEPKRTVDNPIVTEQEIEHSTEESQIPEIEDEGKELIYDPISLPYNQSLLSSTQDSLESLAAPQEADLDDEQIRALLASPRYFPEREASAERS